MTTTNINGRTPATTMAHAHELARAELDAWDDAIAALDQALADVASARRDLADAQADLDDLTASVALTTAGRNETDRKARAQLALAELSAYQCAVAEARNARERLANAERRVIVLKERCRLLRASLALLTAGGEDA